jgi:uncharacterized membrane protein
MKENLSQLFGTFAHEIIFIHILSAIIWVGGMIAIRLAVHPNLMLITDTRVRLSRTLAITGHFFNIVIPFILLLLATAIIMSMGIEFTETKMVVHIKETLWSIMALNFTWMYRTRTKAQKFFNNNQLADAKLTLAPIPKLLLPLNIFLGIVALWLGVTLRGF